MLARLCDQCKEETPLVECLYLGGTHWKADKNYCAADLCIECILAHLRAHGQVLKERREG